jgi:hydroxyacylglutathione hydrolase
MRFYGRRKAETGVIECPVEPDGVAADVVIERWTGPPVDTHTYLVADEESGAAWVVDAPLDTANAVLQHVRERGYTLAAVVLTHGHFDHILDVARYQNAGIPVWVNPAERPILEAPQTQMFGLPMEMPVVHACGDLTEGKQLRLGAQEWEVWEVPGHSPGHVILHNAAEGVVLGGDLLFQGGYGRVDLPGCDPAAMAQSLRRLTTLPRETRVYPGHGPDTTLGKERGWLRELLETGRL